MGHSITHTNRGRNGRDIKLTSTATLLGDRPQWEPNKIIEGHVPVMGDSQQKRWTPCVPTISTNGKNEDGRVLQRALVDDGQGKSSSDMDISSDKSAAARHVEGRFKMGVMAHILLRPPIIETTRRIATGATTPALQKQNKAHWINTLLSQSASLKWTVHNDHTLLPEEHWDHRQNAAEDQEMSPQGLAL